MNINLKSIKTQKEIEVNRTVPDEAQKIRFKMGRRLKDAIQISKKRVVVSRPIEVCLNDRKYHRHEMCQ
jgi:hypothetical protein